MDGELSSWLFLNIFITVLLFYYCLGGIGIFNGAEEDRIALSFVRSEYPILVNCLLLFLQTIAMPFNNAEEVQSRL